MKKAALDFNNRFGYLSTSAAYKTFFIRMIKLAFFFFIGVFYCLLVIF